MPAHHSDANDMTDDGGCRRSFDAPSKPLDKNDVTTEINGIVNKNGDRHQSRTAIDAHHRGQCPSHHLGRRTDHQREEIVARGIKELFIGTKPSGDVVSEEQT